MTFIVSGKRFKLTKQAIKEDEKIKLKKNIKKISA